MNAASSGSDSSDDDDEEQNDNANRYPLNPSMSDPHDDVDDSSGSNSSDEEENGNNEYDSNDDGDFERAIDHDDDEKHLPLAQRVQRQNEQGIDLQSIRQRKMLQASKVVEDRAANKKKNSGATKSKSEMSGSVKEKKKSKHAPTEASSKRADFYKRKPPDLNESGLGVDINAHRYKPRDPRINNLNGHLDMDHFETNYSFLQDIRRTEIAQLKTRIAARKKTGGAGQERRRRLGLTSNNDESNGDSLEQDRAALKQLLHEQAEQERQQVDRAVKRTVQQTLRANASNNNNNVYRPKRKELKRLHVEAKFEELQKRGGDKAVDRALAKRRKKNKSRDAATMGGRSDDRAARFPV